MPTRAVIFDLYGTLVKQPSMDVRRSLLAEMAAAMDIPGDAFVNVWMEGFWERQVGVYGTEERHLEYIAGRVGVGPRPRPRRPSRRGRPDVRPRKPGGDALGRGGHVAGVEGRRPAAGPRQQLRRRHPEGLGRVLHVPLHRRSRLLLHREVEEAGPPHLPARPAGPGRRAPGHPLRRRRHGRRTDRRPQRGHYLPSCSKAPTRTRQTSAARRAWPGPERPSSTSGRSSSTSREQGCGVLRWRSWSCRWALLPGFPL